MLKLRTMIVLSAVAATGIAFLTDPSHSEQTVGVESVKIQDRHPAFNVGAELRGALKAERNGTGQPAPTSTPKADRLDTVDRDCASYTWPNIPTACLTVVDSNPRTTPRVVSIEHRPAERLSIVTPTSTIVAQR